MIDENRRVSIDIHYEISQHYFKEATYLQNWKFREWLSEMVDEEILYWMPIEENRMVKDRRPEPTPDDAAVYNDRYKHLKQRVEQFYTGQVWQEDPRSKIRYYVSNIEAFHTDVENEFAIRCNVLVLRHRRETQVYQHSFLKEDLLRKTGTGFKVVSRKLTIDARSVQDKNLFFFM